MKNIFKILLFVASSLLVFSCQERDADPTVDIVAITGTKFVNAPTGTYRVTENNLTNPFHTFILERADYGTPIELTYQVEIARAGTNFTPVFNLGEPSTKTNIEVSFQQLNNALAELGLDAGVTHDVVVRLKATSVNKVLAPSFSAPATFKVIPYEPNYDLMYASIAVPGNYGGASGYADWTPENSPRLYSARNNDQYAGFVRMNNANPEFKFTYANRGWGNNKGDTANPNTYATLRQDGENIRGQFPNATYFIRVNWAADTYSVQRGDVGLIGEATPTGWGSDTDLTFDVASKKFVINSIALQGGKPFKFRLNDAWDMKIQPQNADVNLVSGRVVQVFNSGEGTVTGDPNFVCPATGNYRIELDLRNSGRYTLKITRL